MYETKKFYTCIKCTNAHCNKITKLPCQSNTSIYMNPTNQYLRTKVLRVLPHTLQKRFNLLLDERRLCFKILTSDPKRYTHMISIPWGSASTRANTGTPRDFHSSWTNSRVATSGKPLPCKEQHTSDKPHGCKAARTVTKIWSTSRQLAVCDPDKAKDKLLSLWLCNGWTISILSFCRKEVNTPLLHVFPW